MIPIETDRDGIIPDSLRSSLRAAQASPVSMSTPKALYTIPTGQNPSGTTCPIHRKREIYEICSEYDIIILEDDPYWYLYYGREKAPSSVEDFSRPETHSYLSMDVEGRVLRFDSMSKVLSSGLRLGMVTGPKPLVSQIDLHSQATCLHTSGVSQMLVSKLLKDWGEEGWNNHVKEVSYFYARRRDLFMSLLDTYVGDLADYYPPEAGMFAWIKPKGIEDSYQLVKEELVKEKVLLVPGSSFSSSEDANPYVRASFSTVTEAQMHQALQRLANVLSKNTN